MKTIMKKVLSVLMVLAILLVPMTVMAATGDSEEPWQLIVASGPMDRLAVTVEAGGTQWVQAADMNGTVEVGYATGNYILMYGRMPTYPETESGNYTATLQLQGYDLFSIYNPSETDSVTVYLMLSAGVAGDNAGTMDNPEVLEFSDPYGMGSLTAIDEAELEANNQGRYYKVIAPADGALAVSVYAHDSDWNEVGWQFNANNITAGIYGDNNTSADEDAGSPEMIPVSAGDEVIVFVSTFDPENVWNNPVGIVNINIGCVAKGSPDYPEVITDDGKFSANVEAGSQGYFYSFVAPSYGKVTVTMDDESGWQYQVNKIPADKEDYGSYHYGDVHTYVGEETEEAAAYSLVKAADTSATISFADKANRTSYSTSEQIWEQNGITVTNNKAGSTSNVGDYANPARFYKSSDVIIEYAEPMAQIVITANSGSYATSLGKSLADADAEVTVNASTVTIVPASPATSFTFTCSDGQIRVDSIAVYTGGAEPEPEEPAYDPTGKTPAEIVDAAYELEVGKEFAKATTLTGVITSVDTVYSEQFKNVTVTIAVDGADPEKPIQCFRLEGDGADVIAVGDTITVTGNIKNYNGTIEFDAGCTLDSYVKVPVANVVSSEELTVYAGETVTIMVNTYNPEDEWNAPAGTVNWSFDFAPIAVFMPVDTDAYIGNEFDVVINLDNNPGIVSLKLDVAYDSSILELVGVKDGVLTGSTESDGETLGCYFYSESLDANPYTINWIDALSTENITTSGAVATLTFRVKDTAELGETTISVSYNSESVFDKDFNNVAIETMEGTVSIVHKLVTVPEVAATCTESGVAEHEKCEVCGKLFMWGMETTEEELVIAPQHDYVYHEATEPTCSEVGMLEHEECSICGTLAVYNYDLWEYEVVTAEDITIPVVAHTLDKVEKVEPTTEATGMKEHYVCSVCGALFADEAGETPVTEEDLIIDKLASHIPGDVNGDGVVNNKDLGLLMQHLNDWDVAINLEAADVNADDAVNNKDYGLLMQYLNDWDVELK